jgi:four helix bundle protein
MAKGSSAEVLTQAIIAREIDYIDLDTFKEIEGRCLEISSMLSRLIAARSKL